MATKNVTSSDPRKKAITAAIRAKCADLGTPAGRVTLVKEVTENGVHVYQGNAMAQGKNQHGGFDGLGTIMVAHSVVFPESTEKDEGALEFEACEKVRVLLADMTGSIHFTGGGTIIEARYADGKHIAGAQTFVDLLAALQVVGKVQALQEPESTPLPELDTFFS